MNNIWENCISKNLPKDSESEHDEDDFKTSIKNMVESRNLEKLHEDFMAALLKYEEES